MNVLIVEDDPLSARLLERILRNYGDVEKVDNGHQAIERFERSLNTADQQQDRYHLICLDLMMPIMDGHQTLQTIRDIENQRKTLPHNRTKILIVSALQDPVTIMRSFNEECDGYLCKPVNRDNIRKKLMELELLEFNPAVG
jgi:two-component system chemotaxis response regulator CheY